MKIILLYIVSYVIFPTYGVAAHPGLAVAFVAGLGGSGPLVLVGVVILAIGFPVGVSCYGILSAVPS
jgi:hypothetical protein